MTQPPAAPRSRDPDLHPARSERQRGRRFSRRHLYLAGLFLGLLGLAGGAYFIFTAKGLQDYLADARQHIAQGDRSSALIDLKNAVQADPRSGEARFLLGRLYLESGQYRDAEKELKAALGQGYRHAELRAALARTLIGMNQPKRVLDEISPPSDATPAEQAALVALRARARLMLGDSAAAQADLDQADRVAANQVETLTTRAQLAIAAGQPERALEWVTAALAQDRGRAELWTMQGDLLRVGKHGEGALKAYAQALAVQPGHLPAHLAMVLVYLDARDLEHAGEALTKAKKFAPANLMLTYLDAMLDFRKSRLAEAHAKIQEVIKAAPDYLPGHLLAGTINLALGNRQSAIAHLQKVLEEIPEHAHARKLLAAALVESGNVERAQELIAGLQDSGDPLLQSLHGDIALRKRDYALASAHFAKALEISPDNVKLLTELAQARQRSGDEAGAIEALTRAAELDTGSTHPEVLLVMTHLKAGRFTQALAVVDRLQRERPQDPQPHSLRGIIKVAQKDPQQARASFTQALRLDPAYLSAATNLARLDLQAGDIKSARSRYLEVLKHAPKAIQAWLALAGLAAQERQEGEFLNYLAQAKQANPADKTAYQMLARYWLGKRDADKATAEARAGLSAAGDAEFHELLGLARMLQGDLGSALISYGKWAELQPGNAMAHLRLGELQNRSGRRDAALHSLDEALRLAPDLYQAHLAKTITLAEAGRGNEAMALAQGLQRKYPDHMIGPLAEAEARLRAKQPAEAASAYTKAARMSDRGDLASRAYLAHEAAGQHQQGMALLRKWLADHPKDRLVGHRLASALLKEGKQAEAAQHYARLYQDDPKDLEAANNLAWLYGELKDARAIAIAEQAHKLAPDNPATQDTLGWILVNSGQVRRGLELLQRAYRAAADHPSIHWHLASALAKSGDTGNAKVHLEVLLDSGRDFPERAEAIRLAQQLRTTPAP